MYHRWQRGGKGWLCPDFRRMGRFSWGKWGRGKNVLHRGGREERQTYSFFMETCFLGMVTARVKGHHEVTTRRAAKSIAQSCRMITSDFYRAVLCLSWVSRMQNEECAAVCQGEKRTGESRQGQQWWHLRSELKCHRNSCSRWYWVQN